MSARQGPRTVLVLTRSIPRTPRAGRERTLSFIVGALSDRSDARTLSMEGALAGPLWKRMGRAASGLIRGLLRGRPLPIQLAIFRMPGFAAEVIRAIHQSGPDAVYFDSIRTAEVLIAVRHEFPQLRLVCDFDDLMSLRYRTLLDRNLPVSLGYIGGSFPRALSRLLDGGVLSRMVLRYEAMALGHMERLVTRAADAVTLVSNVDAQHLHSRVGEQLGSRIHVVPPGSNFPSRRLRTRDCRTFVFVGSDALLQNRLTIRYLLDLWERLQPARPLHIVGKMTQSWRTVEGVTFRGFVEDIGSMYRNDCIALCPSFLEGGIKTKVLEALGHGVVVVGNDLTFAGMGCQAGSLSMTEPVLESLVCNPQGLLPVLVQDAQQLLDCLASRHGPDAVAGQWTALLLQDRGRAATLKVSTSGHPCP